MSRFYRWRFGIVLLAAFSLADVQPMIFEPVNDRSSFDTFFSLLVVAVLLSFLEKRLHRVLAIGFAAVALLAQAPVPLDAGERTPIESAAGEQPLEVTLLEVLERHCSLTDLRRLTFTVLGKADEELRGETISAKAMSLIEQAVRDDRLEQLRQAMKSALSG